MLASVADGEAIHVKVAVRVGEVAGTNVPGLIAYHHLRGLYADVGHRSSVGIGVELCYGVDDSLGGA